MPGRRGGSGTWPPSERRHASPLPARNRRSANTSSQRTTKCARATRVRMGRRARGPSGSPRRSAASPERARDPRSDPAPEIPTISLKRHAAASNVSAGTLGARAQRPRRSAAGGEQGRQRAARLTFRARTRSVRGGCASARAALESRSVGGATWGSGQGIPPRNSARAGAMGARVPHASPFLRGQVRGAGGEHRRPSDLGPARARPGSTALCASRAIRRRLCGEMASLSVRFCSPRRGSAAPRGRRLGRGGPGPLRCEWASPEPRRSMSSRSPAFGDP